MKSTKKDFDIRFRVSAEEKQKFLQMLKSTGFGTFSSLLRHLIFQMQGQIKWPLSEKINFSTSPESRNQKTAQNIASLLQKEIGKIGVNINQTVKKLNHTHGTSDLKILSENILSKQKEICDLLEITNNSLDKYISNA